MDGFLDLCIKYNIHLIADEIYALSIYDNSKFFSVLNYADNQVVIQFKWNIFSLALEVFRSSNLLKINPNCSYFPRVCLVHDSQCYLPYFIYHPDQAQWLTVRLYLIILLDKNDIFFRPRALSIFCGDLAKILELVRILVEKLAEKLDEYYWFGTCTNLAQHLKLLRKMFGSIKLYY